MGKTVVAIDGQAFLIDGRPTYPGRSYRGMKVEGLLLNARLVQGIFDDLNPQTRGLWDYPDGPWDPERNTAEFIQAMPAWRARGLVSFTINLQGGSPQGYSKGHPWHNSAFKADGELRPELERLARDLDLDERLVWAGFVREQELIYADTDLLVLTSDNEGLPVAVLEALASGRPVVSTRVGGVPELIEDGKTGFIVPPGDHEALADTLVHALGDMDRLRAMGRQGQQRTLEEYNAQRLIRDIDRLYGELLRKRNS